MVVSHLLKLLLEDMIKNDDVLESWGEDAECDAIYRHSEESEMLPIAVSRRVGMRMSCTG